MTHLQLVHTGMAKQHRLDGGPFVRENRESRESLNIPTNKHRTFFLIQTSHFS